MRENGEPHPVYLITGDDAGLVSHELSALTHELTALDSNDVSVVEEHGTAGRDETFELGPVLDALQTPSFLASRRIVVLRDAGGLDGAQVKELIEYVSVPLESNTLVITHPNKAAPQALSKAVRAVGLAIASSPAPTMRARGEWFATHLNSSSIRLDRDAAALVQSHIGEDLGRLEGILGALEAAFGTTVTIRADDVEPFLGTAGGVAPWDLTDALDKGDTAAALTALDRLLNGGERHPLQIIASIHRYFAAMLRLDGSGAADETTAATLTGMKPFPAGKALRQSQRLGHERIARAIELLAATDLDLRGKRAWPGDLALEILVARLAQLARLPKGRTGVRAARPREAEHA